MGNMQPASSSASVSTDSMASVFSTHPLNLSNLSTAAPPFSTFTQSVAVSEAASELAKRLRPTAPLAVGTGLSVSALASCNGALAQPRLTPTTPAPQFNLVSLPSGFEPISPLDLHIRPDAASGKQEVGPDLSSSGGFQSANGPDTPSKAKRRKAQLELLDAEPSAVKYDVALPSGTQVPCSTVQQSFALATAQDGTAGAAEELPVSAVQEIGKPKRKVRKPPEEESLCETNRPARFNLIRTHYSFYSKWARALKRRHFERVQHVTTSRVLNVEYDDDDSDSDADSEADDDERRVVASSQNRARLRVAAVLEQLAALGNDDAEMARRVASAKCLSDLEKHVAVHSEQLRRTVGEASRLLLDTFDRHSKLRRTVIKQNTV